LVFGAVDVALIDAGGSQVFRRKHCLRPIANIQLPDSLVVRRQAASFSAPGAWVKLYRIDKVATLGGPVLKKKHVLAASADEAMKRGRESADCPTCEVLGEDGKRVGSIV
jgi:hypothetical protein